MKEQKSNKANDIVVLSSKAKSISGPTPTKQEQAGQPQPGGKVKKQYFPEVMNKDTFGPPGTSHLTGQGFRGEDRLDPRNTE
jgi:hypothetical protein